MTMSHEDIMKNKKYVWYKNNGKIDGRCVARQQNIVDGDGNDLRVISKSAKEQKEDEQQKEANIDELPELREKLEKLDVADENTTGNNEDVLCLKEQIELLKKENEKLKAQVKDNETILKLVNETCKNQKMTMNEIKGMKLHKGMPLGLHECSICREEKDNSAFSYYTGRVDKYGFLLRSNAHCKSCSKISTKERKDTLKKAEKEGKIPPKPKPGDICTNCNRKWGSHEQPRNWHQDHNQKTHEFRRWLCGDCNMALHDHRHNIS